MRLREVTRGCVPGVKIRVTTPLGYLRNLTQRSGSATLRWLRNLSQRSYNGRVLSDEGRVVVEMRIMDFIVVVDGEFREHWATIGPLQPVQQA